MARSAFCQWKKRSKNGITPDLKGKSLAQTVIGLSHDEETAMTTEQVLGHLEHVKRAGPGKWMARCPAHEDRDPSLSISDAEGNTLLKCHAGCETGEIVKRAGLTLRDLF